MENTVNAIELRGVTKRFGEVVANDRISMTLRKGEILSILGENEDSTCLTLSQMIFAALFAFAGWLAENAVTGQALSLPVETEFWISALFIGVFIRAIYGILQVSCQKYVSALQASLIFSGSCPSRTASNSRRQRSTQVRLSPVASS